MILTLVKNTTDISKAIHPDAATTRNFEWCI